MTTKSNNPKAPRDCKETQPSTKGVVAVSHRLKALSLMPLHALAEGRNQTIPSLLCDLTGLSKARISKGNLDAVRPSTKAKINLHLEELLQVQFKDDPEGLDELMSKVATSPVTSSGEVAPLAGWVHQLEFLPWIPLPATKAVALTVDELLEALLACCREDDLPNFKTVLLTHFKRHGLAVCADGQIAMDPVPETELAALQAMANWEHADQWTRNLVDYLYWDLISSLDAEWNSHYFAGRQTMSLFPLVMVRPQEGLLETMRVSSRKNIYLKPVRRLLQFLYALAFYFRYKRWPARAPTPKTLAEILYRPGSLELADESLISNYFDGSTKLTLDLVQEHWWQLMDHFMPMRVNSKRANPPLPLIMLALQWQTLLVQDKGRSFLMPDMKSYETLWRNRREQWQALQIRPMEGSHNTSRALGEPIQWPAWSLNQSSAVL